MADCIKRSDVLELSRIYFSPDWEEAVPVKEIRNIPSADVAEVRHGENIGIDYAECDQFVCSECGIELQNWVRVERDEDDGDETHHEYVFNFCPNCGARMDGGT